MFKHGDVVANARRSLVAMHAARVRRKCRFDIHLFDRSATRGERFVEPDAFFDIYDRVVRPLLGKATRCEVFHDLTRPGLGGKVDPASAAAIAKRGADPERWREAYLKPSQGGTAELLLSSPLLDDRLFWWWVVLRPAGLWPAFVVPMSQFDPAAFFRDTFDPDCVTWSFDTKSAVMRAFAFAKEEAASGTAVAFIPTHRESLEVVARAREAESLFNQAAHHARISERLWARS